MKRFIPFAAAAACVALTVGTAATANASTLSTAKKKGPAAAAKPKIGNPTTAVTLTEDGSSLLEPYLQELVAPLHSTYPNITLAPAAGGSGKGITDAAAGNVNMGGSDAYLSPADIQQYPGLLNIPIAVSGQAINYNVPGVTGTINLSGPVIAQIYTGKITKWNAPAIAALNKGVTLPATTIVPVHREDSSGDTFNFTSFLSTTNPTTWGGSSGPEEGTTVTWPSVTGELSATGNPGMVQTCAATPGCIAYVGVSAESSALAAKLGEAKLKNASGKFLLPTQATETAAAAAGAPSVPASLAASLIFEKGATAYPIVNFEYIITKTAQTNAATALAVRSFLAYSINPTLGSSPALLSTEDFVALPASVVPKVNTVIAKVTAGH